MGDKPDYRDLIVDCPACRASVQMEHLDGATYKEFEPLLRSVRAGNVVRVYRPFLLGGVKVREAVAAINEAIAPREVTAPWLYVNVK